jgi:hypothetical protein
MMKVHKKLAKKRRKEGTRRQQQTKKNDEDSLNDAISKQTPTKETRNMSTVSVAVNLVTDFIVLLGTIINIVKNQEK